MPLIRRQPILPPATIRRPPTAIVHQPIAASASASAPTMGSMVKSGFSWGIGNGIANALVGSVINKAPTTLSPESSAEYVQCMKDFDDKEACKDLLK